jgi:hypothetical protein
MNKLLLILMMSFSSLAVAEMSSSQVIQCVGSNFVLSVRYGDAGDSAAKASYEKKALTWLRYGRDKFGDENFNNAYSKVAPSFVNEADKKLMATSKSCDAIKN